LYNYKARPEGYEDLISARYKDVARQNQMETHEILDDQKDTHLFKFGGKKYGGKWF